MKNKSKISVAMQCMFLVMVSLFVYSCCALTNSCSCQDDLAGEYQLDGENLEWINYEANDTFNFMNELGDVGELKISSVVAATHFGDRGDECKSDEYDALRFVIDFKGEMLLSVEIGGSGEIVFIQNSQLVGTCFIANEFCRQLNNVNFSGEFMPDLTIENIEYSDVFKIDTEDNLDNIYWTKKEGIVRFTLDDEIWNLTQ